LVASRNSTFVTLPSLSVAVAAMLMVRFGFHVTTTPSAGEVMLAVGGWASVTVGGWSGEGGGGGGVVLPTYRIFATEGTPAESTMKSM
jgi:hypothetical protein